MMWIFKRLRQGGRRELVERLIEADALVKFQKALLNVLLKELRRHQGDAADFEKLTRQITDQRNTINELRAKLLSEGDTVEAFKEAEALAKKCAVTADNELHSVMDAVSSMLGKMEKTAAAGALTLGSVRGYRGELVLKTGRKI